MGSNSFDIDSNTAEAVLRVALAIAYSDDSLQTDERDKVLASFTNICERLGNDEEASLCEDSDALADQIIEELIEAKRSGELSAYLQGCASAITDKDLRELSILEGLRIAGGDHDLDPHELKCLKHFCEYWGLNLRELVGPVLEGRSLPYWYRNPDESP